MAAIKRSKVPRRDGPARGLAACFVLVGQIGLIPGVVGVVLIGMMFIMSLLSFNLAVAAGSGVVLAFILFGFLLQCGYVLRMLGKHAGGRRLWVATLLYNLVPTAYSVFALTQSPSALAVGSSLGFLVLCALAVAGIRAEGGASGPNAEWERRYEEAISRVAAADADLLRRRNREVEALADFDRRLNEVSFDFERESAPAESEAREYAFAS